VSRRPTNSIPIVLIALLAFVVLLVDGRCRAQESPAAVATPASKLLGVWQGTTLASCAVGVLPSRCNAQQKVTITVIEGSDSKVTGFYQCAYGTQNCLNMNESGKVIEGTTTGNRITLRVLVTDGSSYIFTGYVQDDMVNGGYTVYSGGALLERGSWVARRIS
jgi:hypothetical protein